MIFSGSFKTYLEVCDYCSERDAVSSLLTRLEFEDTEKLARPSDVQNSKPYDSLNLNTPRRFPSFFDSTFRPSYSVGKAYARKQ